MKMSAKSAREFTTIYTLYRDCPHSITYSTYSLGRICAHLAKSMELFSLQALRRTKSQVMKRRIVKMMSQKTMMSLMKTKTHLVVILMQAPMMTTHQEMKVLMMILPMLTMIILLEIEVKVIVMMTFLVS